jgi:hypothetical protein
VKIGEVGGASCACSWIDASGDANCSFGNCSAGNQTTWESTCDGTYYFQHPDPIQLCQSIILPIRLVNFYGEYNSPTNEITWVTGSEINNDFFIIYTSTDGEEWIEVSRLPGAGNVSDERKYRVQH